MNIPEFAQAVEQMIYDRRAVVAEEIVKSDLSELDTAKKRGHWYGLCEARDVLRECVKQLTDQPPAEPPVADQPEEESVY